MTGIEPVFPVGKTGVLGRCTTRTNLRDRYLGGTIVTIIDGLSAQNTYGGIGWTRTNCHPVNNQPLFQLSFDPRVPVCCHTGSRRRPRLRSAT